MLVTRDQDGCRRICLAPAAGARDSDEDGAPDVLVAYSTSSATPQGVGQASGQASAVLKLDDSTLISGSCEPGPRSLMTANVRVTFADFSAFLATGQVTFTSMEAPESEVAHIAPVAASAVTVLSQAPYHNTNAVFAGHADGTVAIHDAR